MSRIFRVRRGTAPPERSKDTRVYPLPPFIQLNSISAASDEMANFSSEHRLLRLIIASHTHPNSRNNTMFARSVSTSLRSAVARPSAVAYRAVAVRAYSAEASEAAKPAEGEQSADEKKIAELEAKVKELTVSRGGWRY